MPLRYDGTTIGKVRIAQERDGKKLHFEIQIRQGNCLAVLIHVRKCTPEEQDGHPERRYMHTLYTFYSDAEHMKNLLKHEGDVLFDEVTSISLNMYYKQCATLLKYFTKAGHKVTCYYKEPKK